MSMFLIIYLTIAHNVLGNWRFAVANKGLRSKTSNRKMWREKPHKGLSPTAVFWSLAVLRRRTVTVC